MAHKDKILHILHSQLGGTASVVFSILNLNKKKYVEEILFTGPTLSKKYNTFVKKKKIIFFYLKIKKYFFLLSIFKIYKSIYKIKPNFIFLHNYQIFPSLFYKFFFRSILIYVDHKAENLKTFRDKISIFFMYLFADKVICINISNYNKLKFFFKNRIIYIANPVEHSFFNLKNKNKSKNKFKIGMAARINFLKLHKMIVDMFKYYDLGKLNIVCEFPGDGELKFSLKKYIKNLNLNKKIKLTGEFDENRMKQWLSSLDLYIQASKGEGMSTVVLQALASGVPVIGSNVCGNKDILQKRPYVGKLFKNNIDDLYKKIIYFYNLKKKEKNKFLQEGKYYVKKYHSSKLIKKQYLDLIDSY